MKKRLLAVVIALFGSLAAVIFFVQRKPIQNNTALQASPKDQSASGVLGLINSGSILDSILNKQEGSSVKLRYFTPQEFGGWYEKMSPDLLKKLDEFRHQWGFPIQVSPHQDAVGREHPTSNSQHNIMKWGEVRAVDVFPKNSLGGYINSAAERKRAYDIAKRVGFTGIGLYTDTSPGHMVHLDVREGSLAKWSRIAGQYKGIDEALV
jgi:hypothetical protein